MSPQQNITLTLTEREARTAIIALNKHARRREKKGHDAAAQKYRELAGRIRYQSNETVDGGLFSSDKGEPDLQFPPELEDYIADQIEETVNEVFQRYTYDPLDQP